LRKAKLIGDTLDDATRTKLTAIIDAAGDRVKLFSDVLTFATPFLKPVAYDPKAVEKFLKKPGATDILTEFGQILNDMPTFDAPSTDKALHDYATAKSLKPGDIVGVVRVAVTGSTVGFGLFDTLAILGRDEVGRRMAGAMSFI
jgi:glutamyl-tRNA synthetase